MKTSIWVLAYVFAGCIDEIAIYDTHDKAMTHAKTLIHQHWEINRTHRFAWRDKLSASCDCGEHDISIWEKPIDITIVVGHKDA